MPSPTDPVRRDAISFIGGGNMARSLIGGLIARGHDPRAIHVAEPNAELREALARDFTVPVHADNQEAASRGGVWVLAVKPQVMRNVSTALSPLAQQQQPLLVSIAAGITSAQVERWMGGTLPVVRCMPNTPALLGAGATGLFANEHVSTGQREAAESLLKATGLTVWVADEALMDVVTALSGSGPAYVFLLAEAMQSAAEAQGLPADAARALTLQTLHGASRMLVESGDPAPLLRQRVTSPGGTTEAAVGRLQAGGFSALLAAAIAAAAQRGRELSAANESPTP